jgi:hypothetical protein
MLLQLTKPWTKMMIHVVPMASEVSSERMRHQIMLTKNTNQPLRVFHGEYLLLVSV